MIQKSFLGDFQSFGFRQCSRTHMLLAQSCIWERARGKESQVEENYKETISGGFGAPDFHPIASGAELGALAI